MILLHDILNLLLLIMSSGHRFVRRSAAKALQLLQPVDENDDAFNENPRLLYISLLN